MNDRRIRQQALFDALQSRILVLDGAMGSILHSQLTRPDVIEGIHRQYLEAGAELIETNSFNGHPVSLSEFQLEDSASRINRAAAEIARRAADAHWTADRPRFVAG